MKTRIKKVIDGYTFESTYYPQHKLLGLFRVNYKNNIGLGSIDFEFDSYADAVEFLKRKYAEKSTSVRYIYPPYEEDNLYSQQCEQGPKKH